MLSRSSHAVRRAAARRRLHTSSSVHLAPNSSSSRSSWAQATESAHSVLAPPPSPPPPSASSSSSSSTSASGSASSSSTSFPSSFDDDPIAAITHEISNLRSSLFQLLGASHPALDTIAKYYFQAEGKHLRPLLVLLMSQATNGLAGKEWDRMRDGKRGVDDSLTSRGGVLNDWNPEQSGAEPLGAMVFAEPFRIDSSPLQPQPPHLPPIHTTSSLSILPTQRRLASITEMIHVASLLHDDVIDTSPLRRGSPSAPSAFGNKLSILGGDFLLGRASVALSRLGSSEVVELMATVVANLVEGEVMQLKATSEPERAPTAKGFEDYMRKTYMKTASLMAKSARSAVVLGGCGLGQAREAESIKEIAYGYGRNLGIAFQLVDDYLDYLPPTSTSLGKPSSGADLRLGLATAPALFAWEQFPQLGPLILRKFSQPGDVEMARDLVGQSDGMERTVALARKFAAEAKNLIERLPSAGKDAEGDKAREGAREALIGLTEKVVERVR